EFPAEAEKRRQYQYRCQIETAAGDWAEARRYLALALGAEGTGHAALCDAVRRQGEVAPFVQGFALLHWLRLGATALLAGAAEGGDFLKAAAGGVLDWPWCKGEAGADYPAPGVLRRVAVVRAARGEPGPTLAALRRLGEMLRDGPAVLYAVLLAAQA